MKRSFGEVIVSNYYRTTAMQGHRADHSYYEISADRWMRRLKKWLPNNRNSSCLDLGCGCGEVIYLLEREGYNNVIGIDLCKEELDQARNYVSAELIQADVTEYLQNTPEHSVDFITALNLLEHLSKDSLLVVLREAARVLKPGGKLIAMVPNAISPFSSVSRYWDVTHELAFTPNNFRQLAPLTGFALEIEFGECAPVPHGLVSGIRFLLWQYVRLLIALWLLIETGNTKDRIYSMDMLVKLTSRTVGVSL